MAVTIGSYMNLFHRSQQARGTELKPSDFTLVIDGYEHMVQMIKAFPFPMLTTGDPVEVPTVLGTKRVIPGQVNFYRQGSITFLENNLSDTVRLLEDIICKGGHFDAWIYNGTPEHHVWRRRIRSCVLTVDSPDLDMENSTALLNLSGTLHYHYYGEEEAGNVPHLNGAVGSGGKC